MKSQTQRFLFRKLHSKRHCLAPLAATTTAIALCISSHARLSQQESEERNVNNEWREIKNFFVPMAHLLAASEITCSCEKVDSDSDPYSEPYRFAECLEYHRSLIEDYRQRWAYSQEAQRTPSTSIAWPSNVVPSPSSQEISTLEYDLKFATKGKYRDDVQFRLAYYYLDDDPSRAFSLLQDLAVRGNHADAMCLFGIVWNEGRCNVEADPAKACVWFARAAELDHAHACYELAVSLYTGEGVAENEKKAVEWFERSAAMGHAAAAYMLGDCLLDGVGVVRDRAEALEWLVAAGEMGHRGARSRVLAVLEQEDWKDYGSFTDGSRQTFKREIESDLEQKKWTEENVEKIVSIERQFTVGGGSGNPIVQERRQSVIAESREREKSIPTATDYVRRAASRPARRAAT
mmetsp:Transcript_20112/g.30243  ORF Transcript_20112/g.30243 Transcript_20112/m.30243 type:complete len:405 (+) Transcript_20112:59-1273(+)